MIWAIWYGPYDMAYVNVSPNRMGDKNLKKIQVIY